MSEALQLDLPDLDATAAAAAALAPLLRPGDVICLSGDLGAGKTRFVADLAKALGVEDEVVSPTFTLENRYDLPEASMLCLAHYDLYRPGEDARRDLLPAMLEAREQGALLAIEWAEPVAPWLTPQLRIRIETRSRESASARRLRLETVPRGWPALAALRQAWSPWMSKESP